MRLHEQADGKTVHPTAEINICSDMFSDFRERLPKKPSEPSNRRGQTVGGCHPLSYTIDTFHFLIIKRV